MNEGDKVLIELGYESGQLNPWHLCEVVYVGSDWATCENAKGEKFTFSKANRFPRTDKHFIVHEVNHKNLERMSMATLNIEKSELVYKIRKFVRKEFHWDNFTKRQLEDIAREFGL